MKNKKKQIKQRNTRKKKSSFVKALNKLMPYILSVMAAFVLFSLSGMAGDIGDSIRYGLYGTFANFATYFIPIFLIYHAIMWNYDIKRGICIRRVVCSLITLMSFSTMQYLIQVGDYPLLDSYSVTAFYSFGKESVGGGVVGGILGKLMLKPGVVIGVAIITFVLVFMILQMFNITPAYMVRSLMKNKKTQEKKVVSTPNNDRKVKKVKPIKPKKIEVFDDGDSAEFDFPKEAYLDTTKVSLIDDEDDDGDNGYIDLNVGEIKSKTEHIPSQLQPYDEEEERSVPEFSFKSSRYTPKEEVPFTGYEEVPFARDEEKCEDKEIYKDKEDYRENAVFEPNDNEEDYEEDYRENYEEAEEDIDIIEEDDDYESTRDFVRRNIITQPEEKKEEKEYVSEALLKKATNTPEKEFKVEASYIEKKRAEEKPKVEEKVKKEPKPKINYELPPLYLLTSKPDNSNTQEVRAELQQNAKIIVETLKNLKAPANIVDITRGPTITRYELQPEPGVRVSRIEGLVNDIALSLAAKGIRIECPIPGKNAIGIEVPNKTISFVYLRDLIASEQFKTAESPLTCGLGKSIAGEHIYIDIGNTPHLLVAGATGMGKSVCINSLLISLLYKSTPDEVRLILIDPKRVELSNYNGIPHLLVPVVCEPKKSLGALQWACNEMENRFIVMGDIGARKIEEYNRKVEKSGQGEKMSRIVIVIDELADLKMAVPDIEDCITRLTQKARAAGIHVIIGTQRPSVDVLTGLIKNNIPSRIAFRVPSQIDSRTILDEIGADKLVSKGDMLLKLTGELSLVRVQGAYVSGDEIEDVINFWKESGPSNYDEEVMQKIDDNAAKLAKNERDVGEGGDDGEDIDPEFYNVLELAVEMGKISSSLIMRRLSLGFQRASRIIDQLEMHGYIGEANGPKPRDVLITKADYQEIMMRKGD